MEMEFGEVLPKVHSEISEERWRRVREDVEHRTLVLDLTGSTIKGSAISCPFHGRDSRPSFYIYGSARGNNSHCFGCPPGDMDRDNVKFVCDLLALSPTQALLWIEKHYDLPPLEDEEEDDSEEPGWLVSVDDLRDPFLRKVGRILRVSRNPLEAQAYARLYWSALKCGDPTDMAKVLGRKRIESIIQKVKNGRR